MSARNKFFILLGIIFVIAATYYFFSTDHSKDLVLIGTVDSNQVIVSAQVEGRIQKLLVDEGTPVKAGDLIAVLDPSELQTQEAAAVANIASLQNKVAEMQHTEKSTSGSTSSDVANAQAKLDSAKAQLLEAKAALDRTASDSRRMIELAKAGVQSEQDRVQAETNLQAAQATVQAQQELVKGGAGGPDFRYRAHPAGECGAEHGAIDGGRPEECYRTEKSSGGAAGIHQRLCPGDWNSFGAGGTAGRSGQHWRADCDYRRSQRYLGAGRDSGNICRSHRLRRRDARALARWHGHQRKGFFQRSRRRFRNSARCEPA